MNFWEELLDSVEFEWDHGNFRKNWEKHQVAFWEAEQVFTNEPLVVAPNSAIGGEERFYGLGRSNAGRHLFVVFTIRQRRIRVISARDMSRKERAAYQAYEKE